MLVDLCSPVRKACQTSRWSQTACDLFCAVKVDHVSTYFDQFDFPDRLDDDWLDERVGKMDEREWAAFMYVLGSRGWTEDELRQRIFTRRWP